MTTTTKVEAGAPAGPEFVDFHGLRKMFSIPRTSAYRLIEDGSVKSVVLRRPGNVRGKRLFVVQSVRDYLNGLLPDTAGRKAA